VCKLVKDEVGGSEKATVGPKDDLQTGGECKIEGQQEQEPELWRSAFGRQLVGKFDC
jgi:hypothetical protein